MTDYVISDKLTKMVEEFLIKFKIVTESSADNHLDIQLMIKALPNKVDDKNLPVIDLFNFRMIQETL